MNSNNNNFTSCPTFYPSHEDMKSFVTYVTKIEEQIANRYNNNSFPINIITI